jgi:hypothetical protein
MRSALECEHVSAVRFFLRVRGEYGLLRFDVVYTRQLLAAMTLLEMPRAETRAATGDQSHVSVTFF